MSKLTRIISWNIRAGGGKRVAGILAQLLKWQPQIIGLSEFRGTPASQWLAAELAKAGFLFQISSVNPNSPAKNALLLASRFALQSVTVPKMPRNPDRWLLANVKIVPSVILGLMHVPNYTTPTLKYPYLASVLRMIDAWDAGPGLVMGDTNCGERGIDEEKLSPPKFQREHDWMVGMEQRGWVDAYRHNQGDKHEYTWYSHRNNGFRLDHVFCSPHLAPAIKAVRHVWGNDSKQKQRRDSLSDHAAIIVDIESNKILDHKYGPATL